MALTHFLMYLCIQRVMQTFSTERVKHDHDMTHTVETIYDINCRNIDVKRKKRTHPKLSCSPCFLLCVY